MVRYCYYNYKSYYLLTQLPLTSPRKRPYQNKRKRTLDMPRAKSNRALLAFVGQATRGFVGAINLYSDFLTYQRAAMKYGWAYARELKAIHEEYEIRRRLYQLQKQKYLEARKIGKRIELRLTARGRLILILDKLRQSKNIKDTATLIIFDIPESERVIRRQLRLLLKQTGYKFLQQSVWLHSGDVYNTTRELIRYLKAEQWVITFRTSDTI